MYPSAIMPSTSLIVAIVFAALFGGALIWLMVYYVHRYIHQRCLELGHWFHTIISRQHELPVHRNYEEQRRGHSKPRSRSSRRRKREQRIGQDSQMRMYESRNRADQSMESRYFDGSGRRGMDGGRLTLPMGEPTQNSWGNYQKYASLGWRGPGLNDMQMPHPPQVAHSQAEHLRRVQPGMVFQPTQQHEEPVIPDWAQQQYLNMKSYKKVPRAVQTGMAAQSVETPQAVETRPGRRRVDYIQICDEYPPMVQGGLGKTARPASASSSSSGGVSEATQEVPRASIPRGKPKHRDVSPLWLK